MLLLNPLSALVASPQNTGFSVLLAQVNWTSVQDFKSGARHNDAGQQMRNVARAMTAAEIDAAAQYYSSRPANAQTQ